MHIEPFLVSSTVVCVIAQRLLRRVCENCAAPYHPDLSKLRRLGTSRAEMADANFLKGKGCQKCGYPELTNKAFLSGLMHDIGKFLVLKTFEILQGLQGMKSNKIRISINAKREFLRVLHTEYGFKLMTLISNRN